MGKVLFTFLLLWLAIFSLAQKTIPISEREAFSLITTVERTPFKRNSHQSAQWFPEAGLGLFIHWGIHSVAALDPSWTMIKNCPWAGPCYYVGRDKYYQLANEFNPSAYDPEKWILAAKQAGFQYVVLTTKHHDGYCLWPSKYGDLNTAKHMNNRDLLWPYVEACRKYGLKVGFYFSPRDWSNPDYPIPYPEYDYKNKGTLDKDPDRMNQQRFDDFFAHTIGQLSELLTNYGKIDLLWFDSIDWPGIDTYSEKVHTWLRTIQPEMVVNPRWDTNDRLKHFGDFKSEEVSWGAHPEIKPKNIAENDWWEFCNSWSGSWGYSPMNKFKDIHEIVKILVYARSFGGNYLLNIGPSADGTMRPGFYDECLKLSDWMKTNKESVIGSQAVPHWPEISNVPLTKNGKCYYAHTLQDSITQISIIDIRKPDYVCLLENGKLLPFNFNKDLITISVQPSDRKYLDDVIKIVFPE